MPEIEDKNAIINDSDSLNKKTKAIPAPEVRKDIDTEGKFISEVTSAINNNDLDTSTINSFSQASQSREEIYNLIDSMCEDSTIAAILETYAEDATEYNENGDIVWAEAEDANINTFINYLLNTMQVNKHAYEWVLSLCKYGDLYLQLFKESEFDKDIIFNKEETDTKKALNEDIKINAYKVTDKYVHYLEMYSNPAEMFELTRFGKICGYIKADIRTSNQKQNNLVNITYRYNFKKGDINIYDATKFAHGVLTDNTERHPEEVNIFLDEDSYKNNTNGVKYNVKHGQSILYNVFKIWRELSLLENSMLLNRVTKSSITRLINVEVGDMPKEQIGPHLQGIKQLIEQKAAINSGKSIQEYTNPGPIENNIYVPTHNGQGAITTGQIGGDVNVSQIPDIEYFQNKFFGAMRIPKQYFGLTDDGAGFSGGESLAIISSRYAKMIKRIQNSLIQCLTDAVNIMLIDKNLNSYIGKFTIKMQPPTTKEEIDRRDNMSSKIAIVRDIMDLTSDIEDVSVRLNILKTLLSNVINDEEVISLIQEEVEKLEKEEKSMRDIPQGDGEEPNYGSGSGSEGGPDVPSRDDPLNLDDELGLDNTAETGDESESLPTPEELGIDFTDSNSSDLQ